MKLKLNCHPDVYLCDEKEVGLDRVNHYYSTYRYTIGGEVISYEIFNVLHLCISPTDGDLNNKLSDIYGLDRWVETFSVRSD